MSKDSQQITFDLEYVPHHPQAPMFELTAIYVLLDQDGYPRYVGKSIKPKKRRRSTPETKAKLRLANLGKKRSPEHCAAISSGKKAAKLRKQITGVDCGFSALI